MNLNFIAPKQRRPLPLSGDAWANQSACHLGGCLLARASDDGSSGPVATLAKSDSEQRPLGKHRMSCFTC